MCVCECMCLFSTLDVLKCNPFLAVHFFHCIVVELLFLPYIFAVLQSLQLIGVCVCVCVCISVCVYACVCEWMSWFCTLEVLEFHPVIVVYFFLHCGRFVDWNCFCRFPIHFHFDWRPQVWLYIYFLWPLSLLKSCPHFFCVCVHIPNAIKVTKFRTIPMKLWFFKIQNLFYFQSKVTEEHQRDSENDKVFFSVP